MRAPKSLVLSATLTALLLASNRLDAAEAEVTAYVGKPFGVARLTIDLDSNPGPDSALRLIESQGRALYPAFEQRGVLVQTGKTSGQPGTVAVYFLFRDDGPLRLNLRTDVDHRTVATPTVNEQQHKALLRQWWRRYVASCRSVAASDAYQPMVENYLLTTLAQRLGLKHEKLPEPWSPWQQTNKVFGVLTGAESVRIAAQSRVLLANTNNRETADNPLPGAVSQPPVQFPKIPENVVVEPIAHHVPEECFYIRCGSFANFMWLRNTVHSWGASVRDLASVRGLNYEINQRMERQLALRETALAKLLGDTVISDVAIVGADTFLRAGPAIGIMFEARSTPILKTQITQLRATAKAENKQITERVERIAGRDVTFLSTPDNRVRSFYAVDGKYHFVTTSRTLARRFLEAGAGKQSLGAAKEFRWARSKQPVSANHAVFVYLSDPFFRQLVSPAYRVEMTRRMRAASEIDVVRLARLAAKAEARPADSIKDLIEANLLPEGFGGRPDGSFVKIVEEDAIDSERGAYGAFIPVPDVEIERITTSEARAYQEFSDLYSREWRRMDPVLIGIHKQSLEDGAKERVTFDVHITPYSRTHYGQLAMWLHSADKLGWADVPGDIASLRINLMGHRYAGGLRDFVPQFAIKDGRVHYTQPRDEDMRLYLAGANQSKGQPFFLQVTGEKPADEQGDIQARLFGNPVWLRRFTEFGVVALNKPVLAEVAPHAKFVEAERPAKLRLKIADLSKTKAGAALNAEGYIRARKVSAGNVLFMRALIQQLHVADEDAREVAERLLSARLVCPLGGEYTMEKGFSDFGTWQSDAWSRESLYQETRVPEGFRAPLLDWFAGLSLEFDIDRTSLSTHIEVDVRTPKK